MIGKVVKWQKPKIGFESQAQTYESKPVKIEENPPRYCPLLSSGNCVKSVSETVDVHQILLKPFASMLREFVG